ncbi:hypothetical protein FB451DRAFT_1528937 [Mycena latifolia]|nr:hypothetical protein FB451DRAFT_1528937 [Mycena latifolia]
MSTQPTITGIRSNNIIICLSDAVTSLEVVSDGLDTPFLAAISNTTRSLLTAIPTLKKNKDVCTEMLGHIHQVLYGIIHLHTRSNIGCELPPNILYELGKFTETLHKIHTFVETQQETSKIKQLFRHGEMSKLLKGCHVGLEQAHNVFKAQGLCIPSEVSEIQKYADKTHQEVLDLILALSDGASSERGYSIGSTLSDSANSQILTPRSSNSLSFLPSEPKIFHGRETEVVVVMQIFRQESPRIAILGAGGMGKTSLARAVLHHPEITAKYEQNRVFVNCDAASSSIQLAALIGAHVGLKPGKNLIHPVVDHFTTGPPCLLILDNLETIWEPQESRSELEKFLCLLADVNHVALIITMRGAERPANVKWTRPFLEPLKPLPQDAARKTFIDIVDNGHSSEDVDRILLLTDNMPLAIDLIAHLVDYEGLGSVLHRWEMERTSLLSKGHDKGSNLDHSISLSLASSRIRSFPQSLDLLSLLSILPEGISDTELVQSKLPIDNILACKAALLRTSLAYTNDQRRLRALLPIREYVEKMHPPMTHLIRPLLKYFNQLLELYKTYHGTVSSPGIVARLTTNFANIQNILVKSLTLDNPDLVNAIYCACHLDHFSRRAGYGRIPLMNHIPSLLPHPCNHRLEISLITCLISGFGYDFAPNAEDMVDKALASFPHVDDSDLKCRFYDVAADFYRLHRQDIPHAIHFCQAGLSLAISTGNTNSQAQLLTRLAWIKWKIGDHSGAHVHAHESQRLARTSAHLWTEAAALRIESVCWKAFGNYNHSISLLNRARDLLGLCGMSSSELDCVIMGDQAVIQCLKSEYVDARNIHATILQNLDQDPFRSAFTLLNIASIEVEMETSKDDIQRNIDTINSRLKAMGYSLGIMYCDSVTAALSLREGNLLIAKTLFHKCLAFAWGRDNDVISYCLERLSDVCLWGAPDKMSQTSTVLFLVHSLKLHQKLEIHKALQFLGDMHLIDGDQLSATSLFTVALEAFTEMDVHRRRAECMLRLGDISNLQGDLQKAGDLWKTARPLFERSSQTKQIAHVDERLAGIHCHLGGEP